jgi:Ferritin-like domain
MSDAARGDGVGSRADLLRRGIVAAGALAAGGFLIGGGASSAASAPSPEQDEQILNFALGLEYLQAGFYAHALERGALRGELREFAELVGGQEEEHVAYMRERLGGAARDEAEPEFGNLAADAERFRQAALVLEESGVGAYIGQGANLTIEAVAAVAPIVSVEARHAAWIRDLVGRNPAPKAADSPRTAAEVQAALERAGFTYPG